MSLVLTVLNGDRAGQQVPLADGLTIGRQDADVALEDRRVSGLHAYVRGSDDGGWLLVDNGSKNGLRDQAGLRCDTIALRPDTQFQIGDVSFRVTLVEERRPEPPPPAARPRARRHWHEVLVEFLEKGAAAFRDRPRGLTPLEPAVVLDFVRGPQVNARWILGYGPRRVGPAALDLPLWGEDLPDVCFELVPSADGLMFKTAHADLVRLNQRPVDSGVLRVGDTIHIKDTLIEVDFTE